MLAIDWEQDRGRITAIAACAAMYIGRETEYHFFSQLMPGSESLREMSQWYLREVPWAGDEDDGVILSTPTLEDLRKMPHGEMLIETLRLKARPEYRVKYPIFYSKLDAFTDTRSAQIMDRWRNIFHIVQD